MTDAAAQIAALERAADQLEPAIWWGDYVRRQQAKRDAATLRNLAKNLARERDVLNIDDLARQAMYRVEVARTGVTKPVNGARPYSWVRYYGEVVRFDEPKYANSWERDAGTGQAAAYAAKINDSLFQLARRAVELAIAARDADAIARRAEPHTS